MTPPRAAFMHDSSAKSIGAFSVTTAIASTSTRPPAARRFEGVVRQFTPNWFTATMGPGILALALNQAPFATPILRCVAEGLWFLSIALFALFSLLYTARWLIFPREASRIFSHSLMSMLFGAIPTGLATIINGFLVFGVSRGARLRWRSWRPFGGSTWRWR
jgi:tellurite resistance protein TehA-like permease